MTSNITAPADSRDMYTVHNLFRQGFGELPDLVRGVAAGDGRAAVVADHARLLVTLLTAHHAAEDAILWPKLIQRCPDEATAIAESMEQQHQKLHDFLGSLDECAVKYRATAGVVERDYLAQFAAGVLDQLHEHLAEEERAVLPLVDRYLTNPEWAELGEHGLGQLTPDQLLFTFGMLLRVATEEERAVLAGNIPPEVFDQMTQAAPPALAAYERKLRG